ncbi:MAG: translocation protein TolB [Verrucomicrobiaceae bacterium]|nr:translocation protein TolB [Verrucomicrobiaceae bacterium]
MSAFTPIACLCFFTAMGSALAVPVDYAKQIAPLLADRCADCHAASDPDGDFALDTFDALLKGGKTGRAIEVGKAQDSLLVKFLEGRSGKTGKNQFMPPGKKEHLSTEEIALVRQWIDEGANGVASGPVVSPLAKLPKVASKSGLKPVYAVEVAPQGKVMALGRFGLVELLDGTTRKSLRVLVDIEGKASAMAFSADGTSLFVAAGDAGVSGVAYQFNVADGKLVRKFAGHTDALYALAISPDGKQLVTGGYDQKIKLWDLATGKEKATLKGHNGCINALAFRPDGKVLASASADRTIKLWDAIRATRLDTFSQPLKEQFAVAFSADGKTLVAGGADSRIRQWQISDKATEGSNPILETKFAHEGSVLRLVMSPDGKSLVSTASDRTIKLWDPAHVTQRLQLEPQSDWASGVAWVTTSSIVAGRQDGTTGVYDTVTGKIVPVVAATPAPALKMVAAKKMPTAKPGAPVLMRLEPRGFQSGVNTTIKATGKGLNGLTEVKTSDAQLKITAVVSADGTSAELSVVSPKELLRGGYDVSVMTAGGASAKLKLYADDVRQVMVAAAAAPLDLASAADCWGTLTATGQRDDIAFTAKAGQTIVLDLAARRVESKADTIQLEVFDANGRRLESSHGLDSGTDPFIAFKAPAEGRYAARVSETTLEGSADHAYRLTLGTVPYVVGWWPLSVKANAESEVKLVGYNLPAPSVVVKAAAEGIAALPLDAAIYRSRMAMNVKVSALPEMVEHEPNDMPATAQAVTAPVSVNGRILVDDKPEAADADLYAFEARAGEEWMIETEAAQAKTPTDTRIEVLDADGAPVERLKLQAVRSSFNNFRSVDADNPDIRLENYTETGLDEYVYFNGDVMKTFRVPRGPDGGFLFYSSGNKRRAYFDTTATGHPLDEPCYVVEPLKSGQQPVANGLPLLSLTYANDDEGLRKLGSDSRMHFTAPAAGKYLVRVTDSRGWSGERFAYRLVIRRPAPDFAVKLSGDNPKVGEVGSMGFSLRAERTDDFEDAIEVRVQGLPKGWFASSPIVIQAGHTLASGSLCAEPGAAKDGDWSKVTLTAVSGKLSHAVNNFGKVEPAAKPGFIANLEPSLNDQAVKRTGSQPQVITIVPGRLASAFIRVERNGNEGILNFDVHNLPHGIIVDDIGLNGIQVREKENDREIRFACAKWVPEQERLIHATVSSARAEADSAGLATSFPVRLRVVKEATVAGK